jgi:hypothetical protein
MREREAGAAGGCPRSGAHKPRRARRHPGRATGYIDAVGAEAKNFEAIVKAKADHNKNCPFPPHTVRMNPFEIERMQWEEGDTIAGLLLEADAKIGTGAFRLVCDGMEPPELETEDFEAITAPAEPLEVPAGPPGRESEPRF